MTFAEELANRYAYHPPTPDRATLHERVRVLCYQLASDLAQLLPDSTERDKALDRVDEACMYGNAALARHGVPEQAAELLR